MVKEREGFTLVELLVAVSLLAIVVVAVAGTDLAGRRSLISANRRARAQDEVRYAIEHMVRNIRLGNLIDNDGDLGTPLQPETNEIHVWMDWDPTTRQPQNTPDDDTDDFRVHYRYSAQSIEYRVRPPGGPWISEGPIAEEIVDPTTLGRWLFTIVATNPASPIFLTIDLTARHDATSPASPLDNPEVRLYTGVSLRSKARD